MYILYLLPASISFLLVFLQARTQAKRNMPLMLHFRRHILAVGGLSSLLVYSLLFSSRYSALPPGAVYMVLPAVVILLPLILNYLAIRLFY